VEFKLLVPAWIAVLIDDLGPMVSTFILDPELYKRIACVMPY